MLIFTYKLDQFINHKILPEILLSPNYKIVGSFGQKRPYITNIEVINYLDDMTKPEVYQLVSNLIRLGGSPNRIRLVYITCGFNYKDRSKLQWLPEQIVTNRM